MLSGYDDLLTDTLIAIFSGGHVLFGRCTWIRQNISGQSAVPSGRAGAWACSVYTGPHASGYFGDAHRQ